MNIRCWWFGCERHPEDYSDPDTVACVHCGGHVTYSDLVGDTRHYRFMEWLARFNPRRLYPPKCPYCGHRYKCNQFVDHIPF